MSNKHHVIEQLFDEGKLNISFDYDNNCAKMDVLYNNGVSLSLSVDNDSLTDDTVEFDKHGQFIHRRSPGAKGLSRDDANMLEIRMREIASKLIAIGLDYTPSPAPNQSDDVESNNKRASR